MSEPLADRMKRFTPEGAALDRDALLFNAGRASVRPGHGWKLFALSLVFSQVATLGLLWPRPAPRTSPSLIQPPQQPAEPSSPPPSFDPSEWLVLNHRASVAAETDFPPTMSAGPLVPDEPALSVSTFIPE
jgi:hypothetical protein